MRYAVSIIASLWLAAATHAQSLKLPVEIRGDVGQFIAITGETDGKSIKWYPLDTGLSVFPGGLLKDEKTTVVVAARAGRYRLLAYSALADRPSDPATTTVIVGESVPPVPPTPPVPPSDPLVQALSDAYRVETDPDKMRLKGALAALYRQGATTAENADVKTWGQLFAAMSSNAVALGVKGKLPKVQAAIGEYLKSILPTDPARTIQDERQKAQAAFLKVATALEAAKE